MVRNILYPSGPPDAPLISEVYRRFAPNKCSLRKGIKGDRQSG